MPLIPPSFRRIALLTALLGWFVAAVLGIRYAGQTSAGQFDSAGFHLMRWLVGNPVPVGKWAVAPPTVATRVLAALSSAAVTYPVIAVGLAVAVWRRRWEAAALAVLAPGLCVLVTELAKPLFDRRHDGYLSYPSGHTVSSVSALTVLVLALSADWPARRRLIAFGGWLVAVLWVAAGLVAMNYHYPTDTIGGVGVALGVALPGAVLADWLMSRRAGARGTARPAGTPHGDTSSDIRRPASPL